MGLLLHDDPTLRSVGRRQETLGARPMPAMALFAVGECLHGAVQGPLVADLAEPRLYGRYMALSSLSWSVGFALGPAIGGAVLDGWPTGVWLGAAALCLLGSSLALALEPSLPPGARRTPAAA